MPTSSTGATCRRLLRRESPGSPAWARAPNRARCAAPCTGAAAPGPPAKGAAVLACMDARLNPYALLGLSEGDAHVIRNAGGVVTDDEIRPPPLPAPPPRTGGSNP